MQVVCYKVYLHTIIPNTFPLVAADDRGLRSHMTELFLIRIFGNVKTVEKLQQSIEQIVKTVKDVITKTPSKS